jgi:Tfp pilus assembly protein PilF
LGLIVLLTASDDAVKGVVVDPAIFITYSSKDEKVSRTICAALENRGLTCWIASRNIKPGQNFQEQIVEAIRAAKIMVLVFTANANNSNEIKKELALASQNNLLVIPVRIEDVTPSTAFTYELATRQWIDLFGDWENSITRLVELIAAAIDEHAPGDRAKTAVRLTADEAVSSYGKKVEAETAPVIAPASFMHRPTLRWAMISSVAAVVAAGIAYKLLMPPRQPRSVPAVVTTGAPTQPQPSAPVASSVPSQPVAQPPQQTQNSTTAISPPVEAAARSEVSQSVKDQCRQSGPQWGAIISACSSWIAIDPSSAEAYSKRDAANHANNYEQAIDDDNKAIALKPDATLYNDRGIKYYSQHLYDKAVDDFTKAIALDPKTPIYYVNRGDMYLQNGLYDQAIADTTKALVLGGDARIAAMAYARRGYAYEQKGLHKQAISDYRAALRLNSNGFLVGYAIDGLKRLGAAPK